MSIVYSGTFYVSLINYNGDAAGNINGNYGLFSTSSTSGSLGSQGSPMPVPSIMNFNVSTTISSGQDPLEALDAALNARTDLPKLTAIK